MKRTNLALGILSLAFIASCQNEEIYAPLQVEDKVEVLATLADASQTRTHHSDDHKKVLWSENDAISVFTVADEPCHDRYYLTQGVNTASAKFQWDKTFNGVITGGIEMDGSQTESYVGVYPFREGTSVKVMGNSYEINTVIPTTQKYAENSFGEESYVMVGVDLVNSKPAIPFKNVGTILIFQLNGEGTIQSATLKSAEKKIAGNAVVTVSEENGFIPSTDMSNGEYEITLSCGEGVQLKGEEYTKFCFVLAPGVYTDLVVKFTDVYGNFFEQNIENPNGKEMARSMSYNMPKMTFEAQGTEELDLWVKAQAGVYMNVERIIPSVDNLNVEAWVKDLVNQPNSLALVEEAIFYLKDGKLDMAFDVLNGIPGFVKDYQRFEANGTAIRQVTYGVNPYLGSMLEQIEGINDIESLLAFLEAFEEDYEAYGLKTKLNDELGSIADNFNAYIDAFVESQIQKPEEINPEKAYTAYVTTLKSQLNESKTSAQRFLDLINGINSSLGKSYLSGELDQIENHIAGINTVLAVIDNYTYEQVAELQDLVDAIPDVEIEAKVISDPNSVFGKLAISGANRIAGYELINKQGQIVYTIDSSEVFSGEEKDYLSGLLGQIAQNETLIAAAKAALNSAIDDIKSYSLVESLQVAINEPNSTTGLVLNYLFSQEAFMTSLKTTLHDLVAEIEASAKEDVNNGNIDAKTKAINEMKVEAIKDARKVAIAEVDRQLDATNQANLTSGAWGIFKKVLNWETCVKLFTEAGLLDVYNALCSLSTIVDNLITFERTDVQFDIVEFADYQENVDWWVLTYNEEF